MKHLILVFATLLLFASCDKDDNSSGYTSDFIYIGYEYIEFTGSGQKYDDHYLFVDINRPFMLAIKDVSSLDLDQIQVNTRGNYNLYTINIDGYSAKQIDNNMLLAIKLDRDNNNVTFVSKKGNMSEHILGSSSNGKNLWYLYEFNSQFWTDEYHIGIIDKFGHWYGEKVYN